MQFQSQLNYKFNKIIIRGSFIIKEININENKMERDIFDYIYIISFYESRNFIYMLILCKFFFQIFHNILLFNIIKYYLIFNNKNS